MGNTNKKQRWVTGAAKRPIRAAARTHGSTARSRGELSPPTLAAPRPELPSALQSCGGSARRGPDPLSHPAHNARPAPPPAPTAAFSPGSRLPSGARPRPSPRVEEGGGEAPPAAPEPLAAPPRRQTAEAEAARRRGGAHLLRSRERSQLPAGREERRTGRRGRCSARAPRHRRRPRCLSRSAGPGLGGAGRERTSAGAAMAGE